ncbi:hypothetical protein ACFL9U_06125, partial [Thermodesulfobacteriota bacterium]
NKRYPLVAWLWEKLLPNMAHLIAAAPRRLVSSISNALYNLTAQKGSHEGQWLKTMVPIVRLCRSPDIYLEAGKVAAWRCGMAQYRLGALEACDTLPPEIFAHIFGLAPALNEEHKQIILKKLSANPWYDPVLDPREINLALEIVRVAGGFRGSGGPFESPPQVKADKDRIFLFDETYYWQLHADIFGTYLHRAGKGLPEGQSSVNPSFQIDKKGMIKKDNFVGYYQELGHWASTAATADTLVVCLPCSHYIYLVASRKGDEASEV